MQNNIKNDSPEDSCSFISIFGIGAHGCVAYLCVVFRIGSDMCKGDGCSNVLSVDCLPAHIEHCSINCLHRGNGFVHSSIMVVVSD